MTTLRTDALLTEMLHGDGWPQDPQFKRLTEHAMDLERELAVVSAKYDLLGRAHTKRLLELADYRRMYGEMVDTSNSWRFKYEQAERTLRLMIGDAEFERLAAIAEG